MSRLVAIFHLPTAGWVLSGCCCGLGELIPDDASNAVGDAIAEEAAEEIVQGLTGVDVEAQGGRLTMNDGTTNVAIGEGAAALDPRNPVAPFPSCPVAGGAVIEDTDKVSITFTQGPCAAPFEDLVRHFDAQVAPLGKVERMEMSGGGTDKTTMLTIQGDGSRLTTGSVTVSSDGAGMMSVMVLAEAPKR